MNESTSTLASSDDVSMQSASVLFSEYDNKITQNDLPIQIKNRVLNSNKHSNNIRTNKINNTGLLIVASLFFLQDTKYSTKFNLKKE